MEVVSKTADRSVFLLKHRYNSDLDLEVRLKWEKKEGKSRKVPKWEYLPDYLESDIAQFRNSDLNKCPEFCLNLVLRQAITDVERLKKLEDLKPSQAMKDKIRYEDPELYYKDNELIYKSFCNYGVYRTYSRTDQKRCIMKITHE